MKNRIYNCNLELKSLNAAGRFSGYASVFDVEDNQQDIILRGAFTKTLQTRKEGVKLLWQHQMDEPIGTIETLMEDKRGLYVEGRLLLSIARAREAYDLIKAGALSGMSIGYTPKKHRYDPKTGVREIYEVELWEISLVTFPANSAAGITAIKKGKQPLALELAEALDKATKILRHS
jgi:HK97 family phage prohead protease